LDEIENIDFGDKNTIVVRKDGGWHSYQNEKRVKIQYKIGNHYTIAKLWFSTGGHIYYDGSYLFLAEAIGEKYKTKKSACVAMLNELESFVSDPKKYNDLRKEFLNWCDRICSKRKN